MSAGRQPRVGLVIVVAFVAAGVLGPLLAPYSTTARSGAVYEPPSPAHPLGTDDGGVDMLSLLLDGTRVSLVIGFAAAAVAAAVGGLVGLVAGYFGGRTDGVLMRITDYVIVLPTVPTMIVVAALFGRTLTNVVLIIGAVYWTYTARVIRAQVKTLRARPYVTRSRALGAGHPRVITRHVLPQVAPLLIANTVLLVSSAIFAETFIAFLGLGDPTLVSWGRLIQNSFRGAAVLNDAWWAVVPPGVCVAAVVLACTMVGQSIEDSLNPRLRVGHLSGRRFRVRPPVPREVDDDAAA
ncbi:ABC transporter permease [Pseudonocardia acaciae]|uniref:ABC transporter permease n=1 Tax=Pseudonocardia acaciae TaxID=551276 RepID=UPI000684BA44|nr:ABC transporter permease [Pseudonocardia acaciae]